VQLHKAGVSSTIYGKNGGDLTRRFPRIAAAGLGLPAKSCIIHSDGALDFPGATFGGYDVGRDHEDNRIGSFDQSAEPRLPILSVRVCSRTHSMR
jgi:hypothetical protein